MKYILITILLLLMGCTSSTKYGKCIGFFDDKDSKLEYKANGANIFLAIFFHELIIPPVAVVLYETYCPVGVK